MSDSVRPHRLKPTRLPRPWDSPGKNTGVGCHFLLQCMKAKSESEAAQLCLTLSNPMDCSLPGSSIHGIFQARVLEWGAIAFSSSGSLPSCKSRCFGVLKQRWAVREHSAGGAQLLPSVRQDRSCHFFFSKSLQSCLTLCDPIDGSPPGSADAGILPARVLEWACHFREP